MSAKINSEEYIGKKFGYLTILKDEGTILDGGCYRTVVLVQCQCGKLKKIIFKHIKNGNTKSCGCLQKEIAGNRFRIHGKHQEKLYNLWHNMKRRCHDINNKSYVRYGGRGINVCHEWFNSAEAFYDWAMANGWKDGLQIDRIKNNLGYSPDNCRFVTCRENCRNKRNNRYLTFKGQTKILTEWAETMNMDRQKLVDKLRSGKSLEEIFC